MAVDISKTILMKLNFTGLGNSAKVSTAQVECDTDKDLLRVSKKLLDSPELEAIRSLDGEIRRYVYYTCKPITTSTQSWWQASRRRIVVENEFDWCVVR